MSAAMTIIAVAISAIGLVSAFVVSAEEAAARCVPLARVRRLRESGVRGADSLDVLAERPSRVSASRALIALLAVCAMAVVGMWTLQKIWSGTPVWLDGLVAAVVSALVMFGVGEALPRSIAEANCESVGLAFAGVAAALVAIFYPVARVLSAPWRALIGLISGESGAEVPWADAAEEHRAGALEEDGGAQPQDEAFMEAVAALELKVVREVMVPRTDMVAIEDTATMAEALASIEAAGVSRVPVYHETLDDVRGVLYAKDLLPPLAAGRDDTRPIDLARPALFVPETKPVEDLLREMRRRTHIAIVADEYGGTAGLVTIEDLLEEIVGEIFDEYDPQVAMVTALPDGRVRIDARLAIDEIDERFGTALDVEADTAGGLFTELAGHIPQAGETVEVQGLRFTVETMEGNRVRQLLVEPAQVPTEEGDNE